MAPAGRLRLQVIPERPRIPYNNPNVAITKESTAARPWRIFITFLLFVCTTLYKTNNEGFIVNSFTRFPDRDANEGGKEKENSDKIGGENATATITTTLPPVEYIKEVDKMRMLFGIFTYDSPGEAELRQANRETHLSFRDRSKLRHPDAICSLNKLLHNKTLARDPESCRIVYSFVMGGGSGDKELRKKVDRLQGGRDTTTSFKTRCLWEDPECGGTDITRWTLDAPVGDDASGDFLAELAREGDVTLLEVSENHELGKTDTWFTYAAMLTRSHPEFQMGFVGKIDGDNFVRWPNFFAYLQQYTKEIRNHPYIYGGYAIKKSVCSGNAYGKACKSPRVIFEWFATGAMVYLSTPLAQHVFMDGTNLTRKQEVWMVGEDMQLANMVYSDPRIDLSIINHRYRRFGNHLNTHCFNNATLYRREYSRLHPDMRTAVQAGSSNAKN